jgi:hypothetical protein
MMLRMKKFHMILGLFLIIFLLILVACNTQTTATSSPQHQEISTRTLLPPITLTATLTLPSQAATRFASKFAHAPTDTAIAQHALDDCNGYPDTFSSSRDRVYSPSGTWYVAYCKSPKTGGNYTRVINTKNLVIWDVPYLDKDGQNLPEGITGGQMNFEMWSIDERFVYFNRYYCCLDGPGMIFSNGFGLFQLDLSNGKIVEIESGALAPDGYSVVFYDYDNHLVSVKNLKTGEIKQFEIDLNLEEVGIFQWAKDGNKVIFSAAAKDWFETDSGFVLYLIDLGQNSISQVLDKPPFNYIALKWLSDKDVLVGIATYPTEFVFDITTQQLSPIDSSSPTLTIQP